MLFCLGLCVGTSEDDEMLLPCQQGGPVGCSALGENGVGGNLKASLLWDEVLSPSLRASCYKCRFPLPRATMPATSRTQRPRRPALWALMAVLLADLWALSGMYPSRGMKGTEITFDTWWEGQ